MMIGGIKKQDSQKFLKKKKPGKQDRGRQKLRYLAPSKKKMQASLRGCTRQGEGKKIERKSHKREGNARATRTSPSSIPSVTGV